MTSDIKTMEVVSMHGKTRRQVVLEVGKEYVIQPLNPRSTKNRNRKCILLGFVAVSEHEPDYIKAKIRYLDNNKVGRAEITVLATT
jgi:hypothetical protein